MAKGVDYYMSLDYPVRVEAIPKHAGGGFCATIPMLGSFACIGDGETEEEAREDLRAVQKNLLSRWVREGVEIPEPVAASTCNSDAK